MICFVCAKLINRRLYFSFWQFHKHVGAEWILFKRKDISGFKRLPRVVLMYCCDWLFPRVLRCQTEVENHTVTPKSPLCLPHSAARLKSRHPSTPAANITTSPPPAARGWGKRHPALTCKHTHDTYCVLPAIF